MTPHPLDNPVWASLTSRHAAMARRNGHAVRYPAEVAPFIAVDVPDSNAAAQAADFVEPDELVCFVGLAPPLASGWKIEQSVPIAQMTCGSRLRVIDGPEIGELSGAHVADMLALTALVYPHYFRPRTIEMGGYIGIHDGKVLAAMAGRRMHFGGHQEISAVCTHPDYVGRGYARRLIALLTNEILEAGELPFLHFSHDNLRAKALYEQIGYSYRADVPLVVARRRPEY
ncbi:MAG TPA: GNAT family N-acetyltransferase [Rhodanobacteraceae bacterium]